MILKQYFNIGLINFLYYCELNLTKKLIDNYIDFKISKKP